MNAGAAKVISTDVSLNVVATAVTGSGFVAGTTAVEGCDEAELFAEITVFTTKV